MKSRLKTENAVKIQDNELEQIIMIATQQKMLPQLIWDFSRCNNSQKTISRYQSSIKKLYTEETKKQLKYNKQQCRSHREKFREKVLKLISNQLPIDYLKPVKINNSYTMTYNGHPLETVKYPTKKQYRMFQDFSENKFKKDYSQIFDDRLQYHHRKIFKSFKNQKKAVTQQDQITNKQLSTHVNSQIHVQTSDQKQVKNKQKILSLPKLIMGTQSSHKTHNTPRSTMTKKKPHKIITTNDCLAAENRMKYIGRYPKNTLPMNLSLTKESIIRYLKQCYSRPNKIVQFLNIGSVETYDSYIKISQKLKLMPNQHIYFMAFIFYDTNNDGYICRQDLMRIYQLTKKCPLLNQDCQLLEKNAGKIKYEHKLNYKELYGIIDLTQTKYFKWRQKNAQNPQQKYQEIGQLKQFFGNFNRKKIMIHFDGFKKLFKNEKPFFWYDLLWRLGGIAFEGLKYQ